MMFLLRQPGAAVRRGAAAGQRDGGGDDHRGAVRVGLGRAAGRRRRSRRSCSPAAR
ncbi:MAG: hypothetical protein MZW92_19520 [Comamonadaceae bacterium]|nr:hypothetical protein [Comamonadaceae bacterium]